MRVLLVEDNATLRHGLERVLTSAGHQTVVLGDGAHADTLLAAEVFDLVVLDLGLPGVDGLVLLERLRRRKRATPVLILSARDRTEDRVRGLDIGADDYMTKPFELSEFKARVGALLRRGQGAVVRIGALEWSWQSRQAWVGDTDLALSRHESTVLESLIQTPGKVVAKDTLARRLGGEETGADDNLVEVYIHRLRKKLARAGVEVRTVRGLGYVLRELTRDE